MDPRRHRTAGLRCPAREARFGRNGTTQRSCATDGQAPIDLASDPDSAKLGLDGPRDLVETAGLLDEQVESSEKVAEEVPDVVLPGESQIRTAGRVPWPAPGVLVCPRLASSVPGASPFVHSVEPDVHSFKGKPITSSPSAVDQVLPAVHENDLLHTVQESDSGAANQTVLSMPPAVWRKSLQCMRCQRWGTTELHRSTVSMFILVAVLASAAIAPTAASRCRSIRRERRPRVRLVRRSCKHRCSSARHASGRGGRRSSARLKDSGGCIILDRPFAWPADRQPVPPAAYHWTSLLAWV